jgi:hypothetical protein
MIDDEGPPPNAIVYTCPICGAEVESAPGLKVKCRDGHLPVLMVPADEPAAVDDE